MPKKENYEDMVQKLQTILSNMEDENCTLENTIKSYEDGIKLIKKMQKTLESYESRIQVVENGKEVEFKQSEEV